MQTLSKVTVEDAITGSRFVTRYAYHHGHYDGVEREFRGFALVEQWDSGVVSDYEGASNGDLVVQLPSVRTRTWFHTGAWFDIGLPEDYERAVDAFESEPERYLPPGARP